MAKTPNPNALKKGKAVPVPLIGSFLLESITTGMYGERKNAIREYVQNGFDAIQSALGGKILKAGKGKITLTAGSNNLIIHDNGIGLAQRVAVSTLTAVGASRKERGQQAGFRGIGRLAGIAFANGLQFRTKAAGDNVETVVFIDCEELREGMLSSSRKAAADLLSECTKWEHRKAQNPDDHFFEVSLLDLTSPPVEATDTLQLCQFLSQVAPVDFHPDFAQFRKQILDGAAKLAAHPRAPLKEAAEEDGDEASILERIPFDHVAVLVRDGEAAPEQPIYKPYRATMPVTGNKSVGLTKVTLHNSDQTGAWWGWIGHKTNPGDYTEGTVAGIRFRVKNIQIDGSDLIRDVPVTNETKSTFGRWSNWFVGEIHVDPEAVVPNARRDNFEEDGRWLAIRHELSSICETLTTKARTVSDEHQISLETLEKKVEKARKEYLKIGRAKVFDVVKVHKLVADTDKILKDIETASGGAANAVQLRLKTLNKELTQIRVGLLETPKTADYEKFRDSVRKEFLKKTLAILIDYVELQTYDEIKKALEKALR